MSMYRITRSYHRERVSMTDSDEKWHLNESCSELHDQTQKLSKEICLTCLMKVKQRNDKLFRIMKADPENLSFRSLNGTEIVNHFDMGECDVCGAWYYGEPAPLRYPGCITCYETPSCHHGRCCPRQPHGHRQANMFRISPSRYGSSRPNQRNAGSKLRNHSA